MTTRRQAEQEIVRETVARLDQRTQDGNQGPALVITPCQTTGEIRRRIKRAGALSGNSMLRIGGQFLRETDPKLQ